jgi:hypothetical protein
MGNVPRKYGGITSVMVMAFILMITVGGTEVDTQGMYFRDIRRCNFFASQIEQGNRYRNGAYYYVGNRIDGWCVPVMVPSNTLFWD